MNPDPTATPSPTGAVRDQDDALDVLSAPPTDLVDGVAFTRVGRPAGQAPSVLLVHGVGAARLCWAPILAPLTQRYDVLVVDLPGHGASAPLGPDEHPGCGAVAHRLEAACAALDVVRPHVVGNSLGGWIGLEMAADGAASSLLALAPAGLRIRPVPPSPILRWNRRLARQTRPLAAALLGHATMRQLVFASGSAEPAALHPRLARGMAAAIADSSAYEAMLDATAHTRFERRHEVQVPTAIVFGDRDWILPAPNQRPELGPPHAHWEWIKRCGHAPMWDAPERVIEVLDGLVMGTFPDSGAL